ncbi:MAG: KH domain-containing protein [Anaerolineae bacterium]
MRELVEYIAKSLVDNPQAVSVTQIRGAQTTILELRVAPEDKGWVIGRRGRVANAMRTLLHVASSAKGGRRAVLEIV